MWLSPYVLIVQHFVYLVWLVYSRFVLCKLIQVYMQQFFRIPTIPPAKLTPLVFAVTRACIATFFVSFSLFLWCLPHIWASIDMFASVTLLQQSIQLSLYSNTLSNIHTQYAFPFKLGDGWVFGSFQIQHTHCWYYFKLSKPIRKDDCTRAYWMKCMQCTQDTHRVVVKPGVNIKQKNYRFSATNKSCPLWAKHFRMQHASGCRCAIHFGGRRTPKWYMIDFIIVCKVCRKQFESPTGSNMFFTHLVLYQQCVLIDCNNCLVPEC